MPVPTTLIAPFKVFTNADIESRPIVAAGIDGRFSIEWTNAGASSNDVFSFIYEGAAPGPNGQGAVITSASGVSTGATESNPDVAYLTNGSRVLTFEKIIGGIRDIYFRIDTLNADRTYTLGGVVQAGTNNAIQSSFLPEVAALTGGGFAIAWESNAGFITRKAYSAAGVFLREDGVPTTAAQVGGTFRFDLIGTVNGGYLSVSDDFSARGTISGAAGDPAVPALSNFATSQTTSPNHTQFTLAQSLIPSSGVIHKTLVAWVDNDQGGIGYRFLDTSSSPTSTLLARSGPDRLIPNTDLVEGAPRAAALLDGRFMVVFARPSAGALTEVCGQIVNPDGTPDGGLFLISAAASNARNPEIEVIADGRVLVTWSQVGDIFAAMYDPRETGVNLAAPSFGSNFIGTAFADTFTGGAGSDTFTGGGGDDIYAAVSANDVITELSGGGIDEIRTVAANFSLVGYNNVEKLTYTGAAGVNPNVTLTGNALDNRITGNQDADFIDGGVGADAMAGGAGNDIYIVDNAGDVVIENPDGGTADQIKTKIDFSIAGMFEIENLLLADGIITGLRLTGNTQAQRITGGIGDDTLAGGGGADTLTGGQGNDTYAVDNAGVTVTELANGGTDTVLTTLTTFSLASLPEIENLQSSNGIFENITLTGNARINIIRGSSGNDTIDGGLGGSDDLGGRDGNDVYIVRNAGDQITEAAGEGLDEVQTALASYSLASSFFGFEVENLTGTSATGQTLTGNGNNNTVKGSTGADSLVGGFGNDTLDGGLGNDALVGGFGDDVYLVDAAGDVITEAAGDAADEVRTTLASFTLGVTAGSANVENLRFIGSGGFTGVGTAAGNVITGGAGNDTLDGGIGVDVLTGGGGVNRLIGGSEDDFYYVSNASDVVIELAGGGNDSLFAFVNFVSPTNVENLFSLGTAGVLNGNDQANALIGGYATVAQYLNGAGGADTLDGSAARDTMLGGEGDDQLLGRAGNDYMAGENGNDSYYVEELTDEVIELAGAAAGTQDIVYASVNYTLAANVEVGFTFGAAANLAGNGLANTLLGVYSTAGVTLNGLAGNDILYGSNFNDTLNGGDDADTFFGLLGADSLVGGLGNDTYFLEQNTDIPVEGPNQGRDTIYAAFDYTLLNFFENLFIYGAATVGRGNNTENLVIGSYLPGINLTLSGLAGNDTIISSTGDDLLSGDSGNDRLTGGGGNDVFLYNAAGLGIDTITDFSAGPGIGDRVNVQGVFANLAAILAAATEAGGNTTITLNASDRIILTGVARVTLVADDFIF